jgi:hypothetical protein
VRRVVGRVRWGAAPPPSAEALQAAADALVDPRRPDVWTHAVMDVGATICRPRNPACRECPLAATCRYSTDANADPGSAAIVRRQASGAPATGSRPAAEPFPRTARWLRGRIVDRLRGAEPGDWIQIDGPLGDHGVDSVAAALDALAMEGMLERGERGRVRLPLTDGVRA